MDFREAPLDLKRSFQEALAHIRNTVCKDAVQKAKERCGEWNVSIERRIRRKRRMPDENCSDEGLTAEKEIVRAMKSVLDRFQQELCTRFQC